MKKKLGITLMALLYVSCIAVAKIATNSVEKKTYGVIYGNVVDAEAGEPIAGAVIEICNQKVFSDLDGKFEINGLKSNKLQMRVSMISYNTQTVEIDLSKQSNVSISILQQ
ncbi:MAG: carboxypeptidase-like regulatory domain-containing protein [Bacteroidia bacterium]|nr:carboxypeptidase-like regulatory domain-containing protein [Bacteroidia bacterium]